MTMMMMKSNTDDNDEEVKEKWGEQGVMKKKSNEKLMSQ